MKPFIAMLIFVLACTLLLAENPIEEGLPLPRFNGQDTKTGIAIESFEFARRDRADIALFIASRSREPLVVDGSVHGAASFWFEGSPREALRLFARSEGLYLFDEEATLRLSAVRVECVEGLIDIDAESVAPEWIIAAVSRAVGKSVITGKLPDTGISIHERGANLGRVLKVVAAALDGFEAIELDGVYVVRERKKSSGGTRDEPLLKKSDDGLYSIDVQKTSLAGLLAELFALEGREHVLLYKTDASIEGLRHRNKSFEELLSIILKIAACDFMECDGVLYIFEIQRKDILKGLKETHVIPLSFIAVSELSSLLPQELSASGFYRIDKASNCVILSGSAEELEPLVSCIALLDANPEGKRWIRYELLSAEPKAVIGSMPPRFQALMPQALPDGRSISLLISEDARPGFELWLKDADRSKAAIPVRLKYLKADELVKRLPPSISKDELIESSDPSLVFVDAPKARYERFMAELTLIDVPRPLIRYDVLIIQFGRNEKFEWNLSLGASPSRGVSGSSLLSILPLLSLDFEVAELLGLDFALSLSASLSRNKVQVYADTSLYGLSGHEVKFQNTQTVRYQELPVNAEKGTIGVTRELTSGVFLSISGWISGDGMITVLASATVSERNEEGGTQASLSLPTTERIISTQARARSGEPIVLGGLVQRKKGSRAKKTPFFGDIPLIGALFTQPEESYEDSEMAIYIVPRLVAIEEPSLDERLSMLRIASEAR